MERKPLERAKIAAMRAVLAVTKDDRRPRCLDAPPEVKDATARIGNVVIIGHAWEGQKLDDEGRMTYCAAWIQESTGWPRAQNSRCTLDSLRKQWEQRDGRQVIVIDEVL